MRRVGIRLPHSNTCEGNFCLGRYKRSDMSLLRGSTVCDGKVGNCKVTYQRPGTNFRGAKKNSTPQELEARLYQIYRELQQTHPQDLPRVRALEKDAETTVAAYRALNRGQISANIASIANRIGDFIRTSFGKIGEFFTHLSKREPTLDLPVPEEMTGPDYETACHIRDIKHKQSR